MQIKTVTDTRHSIQEEFILQAPFKVRLTQAMPTALSGVIDVNAVTKASIILSRPLFTTSLNHNCDAITPMTGYNAEEQSDEMSDNRYARAIIRRSCDECDAFYGMSVTYPLSNKVNGISLDMV